MRLKGVVLVTTLLAPVLIKGSHAHNNPCSLCSNEGKVQYPDATIPFFELPGIETPTCSDLEFGASTISADSKLCAKYQANAGYCGCPGAQPLNHCTFCPNGDIPARSELVLPIGETCKNLYTYLSFFEEDQCTSLQYQAIANNAYECGCEISMSEVLKVYATRQKPDGCTLCSDGSIPPDKNNFLELAGMTCGEYATFIKSLDPIQCEIQTNRGTFDLFAFQCNCPGTTPPVCPKQENPGLCTISLLDSVDRDDPCECYSFCDGEFVGCDSYPGKFLGKECPQNGVSGCNYASAIDDTEVEGDNSCFICPDSSNDIFNPDAVLPPFSGLTIPDLQGPTTCRDVVEYIRRQNSDDRDCEVAKTRLAHFCGCKNVEPNCTLCPGGIQPSFQKKIATGDTTCEEFAGTVLTWELGTCEIGESYLSVMGARCGCITAEWPVCPVQQNPWLCTTNLLRSTGEDCECYNFCGDQFHGCADYPGEILGASECPDGTIPIAGCNKALATSGRCRRPSIGPGCDTFDTTQKTYLRH